MSQVIGFADHQCGVSVLPRDDDGIALVAKGLALSLAPELSERSSITDQEQVERQATHVLALYEIGIDEIVALGRDRADITALANILA
jgi:hypothetical protein